ncbi:hypothetical protein V5799_013871 [Amblyomma americanum]|uniref:Cytochrome b561 domain-containing protein n=1 Tax=Amblyomma americanum TaxID=6943 RepID=A0AAQ4E4N5_AMBAM
MILGWLYLVGLAIMIARHFKPAWEGTLLLGDKVWFALHRGLMVTAITCVIVSVSVIFYTTGGWSYSGNPHPILGITSVVLGIFQPIMALFRCHPEEPNRYIFNWMHWANGNTAQAFAVPGALPLGDAIEPKPDPGAPVPPTAAPAPAQPQDAAAPPPAPAVVSPPPATAQGPDAPALPADLAAAAIQEGKKSGVAAAPLPPEGGESFRVAVLGLYAVVSLVIAGILCGIVCSAPPKP